MASQSAARVMRAITMNRARVIRTATVNGLGSTLRNGRLQLLQLLLLRFTDECSSHYHQSYLKVWWQYGFVDRSADH